MGAGRSRKEEEKKHFLAPIFLQIKCGGQDCPPSRHKRFQVGIAELVDSTFFAMELDAGRIVEAGYKNVNRHPIVHQIHLTSDQLLNYLDSRSDMKTKISTRISSSKDLGTVLTRARKKQGLSQREVAARLGVTQKWISAVEQGKSRAWIDKVLELSYFLGVQLYATGSGNSTDVQVTDEPSIEEILGQ